MSPRGRRSGWPAEDTRPTTGRSAGSLEAELVVAGVALATVGLVAALAILLTAEVSGAVARRRRAGESPPRRGTVPAERHGQIETAAAR